MNTPDSTYLESGLHDLHADLGLGHTDCRLFIDEAGGVHILPAKRIDEDVPENVRDAFCTLVTTTSSLGIDTYDENTDPIKLSHAVTDTECAKIRRFPDQENAYFLTKNPFGSSHQLKIVYDPITNQPRCYVLYTVSDAEEWIEIVKPDYRDKILAQFHQEILPQSKTESLITINPESTNDEKLLPEVVRKEVISIIGKGNDTLILTYTRLIMEGYFVVIKDQTGQPIELKMNSRPGGDERWRTLYNHYNKRPDIQ